MKSDVIKIECQSRGLVGTDKHTVHKAAVEKHFNTKSNSSGMWGKPLHSKSRPWGLSFSPLHCPDEKLTSFLALCPHTQGLIHVLRKRDTYADILELLWEYLLLVSPPLRTLLVSEKRSDSWPWGSSSSTKEEPDTEWKLPADVALPSIG